MLKYLDIKKTKPEFSVLSGSDSLILTLLQAGGDGGVTSISNLMTKELVGIYDEFKNGNLEAAQANQLSIEEFRKIQRNATIPSILKYAITCNGIDVGSARRPVLPLKAEYRELVEAYVEKIRGK